MLFCFNFNDLKMKPNGTMTYIFNADLIKDIPDLKMEIEFRQMKLAFTNI